MGFYQTRKSSGKYFSSLEVVSEESDRKEKGCWCNNHSFSGNQEEVAQREQLRVAVDWRGQAAAGE